MKNLIYQYWDGNLTSGCIAGSNNMKQYAKRIGADYVFEHNPKFVTNLGQYSPHYGKLKPVFSNQYKDYDNVLYTDTDVFSVNGLQENIFENFNHEVGICTEPFQPQERSKNLSRISGKNDELWASIIQKQWKVNMPRTSEGLLKVYNSGVILWSQQGIQKAQQKFIPFKVYVDLITAHKLPSFYTADQNYLHSMLFVANMNFIELHNGWNNYVHYTGDSNMQPRPIHDSRTFESKFVHIQLRCADNFDADKLFRITNLPIIEWKL